MSRYPADWKTYDVPLELTGAKTSVRVTAKNKEHAMCRAREIVPNATVDESREILTEAE